VTFPETNPAGDLLNIYGRAIGDVARELRHHHLPGSKGLINGGLLGKWTRYFSQEPLFVCEGGFDLLSLAAADYVRAVALIGVTGMRWNWFENVQEIIVAFDNDENEIGQTKARELAREAERRGKKVTVLPPEAYSGYKDANEAWVHGALDLSEFEQGKEK
jgi:hypothetical protein